MARNAHIQQFRAVLGGHDAPPLADLARWDLARGRYAMSPSAKQKFLLAHNIPPALEVLPDDTKRGISAHTDASRLRHLAFAVDRVPPLLRHGLHLEFGVRNALSINFLAEKTNAYGATWDGFDSFVGACHPTRILTLTPGMYLTPPYTSHLTPDT